MLRMFVIAAAIVAALSLGATAQGLGSMQVANDLGSVLASETACELKFNQAAIAAYIDANVEATDMGFASNLSTMTSGHEYRLRDMSTSAKTAHCAQISRVAKSYGFID